MPKPVEPFPELDALRLTPKLVDKLFRSEQPAAPKEKFQWLKEKGFHYYRFPLWTLERLALATKEPWLIVVLVLYRLWYKNCGYNPVRLTSHALRKFNLSRYQKLRALKLLEKTGCITVERKVGKNPRITLNWMPR
jgi:hypothetical protein